MLKEKEIKIVDRITYFDKEIIFFVPKNPKENIYSYVEESDLKPSMKQRLNKGR